ncbi:hypothetical protein B0F90DRAFT_1816081 [Multifurca ochricompacta]|uniref:Ser-Thr-rich glycosyl-phosphatidyl-inositol-anchored membrane family-domain-containing protein n=1 Tax=Multifurca ochricompacta TaxID=376703 RepID=A0AAD4M7A6_9AGAM|nr:hypothetical protein B0F90DRAFT_1816081 [Multifurca ochricompacta]
MKSFVVLSAIITLASALTVNTPVSVVVCEPLQITWSPEGAVSPFYLSIVPAGQPTANAIKRFPRQDGTSYIWSAVDVPAGTSFTIDLKDGKGQEAFSAPVTAQGGGDTSCINGNVEEDGATRSPNSAAPGSVSPGVAAAESSGASEASSSPAAAAPARLRQLRLPRALRLLVPGRRQQVHRVAARRLASHHL